ncbi:helix-turn-helix domain-containing protein [Niveispirillum irakense]|uniref:helix-turn-helix domain-containing protein n=1 Tax=Niveispirillum irakense TaxID=34011 RepID=UPI0003F99F30|nr:AraC family transcriptional regulator [Niveispirillum irakense]
MAYRHDACEPALRGGLAPWQIKRVLATMDANPVSVPAIADLAQACGVSPGHFSRAFKQTTGKPPHQWLMERRVERAKGLLLALDVTISTVAQECGFADQSHLTRVFERVTGTTPGRWRRARS